MNITKDNLTIRHAVTADATQLGIWWRDGEVMAHAGFPNGLEISDEEILEEIAKYSDDGLRVMIIEVNSKPIGEMNYRNLGDSTASIGIKICDMSMQEKAYGTKFVKMLVEELFGNLGYEKIILDANLRNVRARRTYEKVGFQKTGERHNCWTDQLGKPQSVADYELLKSEYEG